MNSRRLTMKLSRAKGCPVWGTQVLTEQLLPWSLGPFVRSVQKFVRGLKAKEKWGVSSYLKCVRFCETVSLMTCLRYHIRVKYYLIVKCIRGGGHSEPCLCFNQVKIFFFRGAKVSLLSRKRCLQKKRFWVRNYF